MNHTCWMPTVPTWGPILQWVAEWWETVSSAPSMAGSSEGLMGKSRKYHTLIKVSNIFKSFVQKEDVLAS